MNLFNIPSNIFSHPGYELSHHVKNMMACFKGEEHIQAAAFHDLGKISALFQKKINSDQINRIQVPHALESAFYFLFHTNFKINVTSFAIFLSILKHHGHLENVNSLAEDLSDSDHVHNHHSCLEETIQKIQFITGHPTKFNLEDCCDVFGKDNFVSDSNLCGLPSYFKVKDSFSKLIFADKYEAIFKESFQDEKKLDAEKYLGRLLKKIKTKTNKLADIRNNARNDVINNFKLNHKKQIFFIEAPTGIGKTFTALQLALEIFKAKHKSRIINALPMTSIIDQTYDEYLNIIDQEFLLKFHHLTQTKEYISPSHENEDEISYARQKNDFIAASWALDKVIITTFNQVLNAFFSNKNKDLIKFWTLRDSVIIFDEIQAIPRILLKDFSQTINFLAEAFNIDFILMSATIPEIKNYFMPEIMSELLDLKYFSMDFNNRYKLEMNENINSAAILADQALYKFENNNSVLAVVNTKKLASELYEQLKKCIDEKEIYLLSTLFIPLHRKKIIQQISSRLKNQEKCLLVSTQVIEAGVDVDFDYGFREFAPLYSIIQTAGRINRENRSAIKNSAELIITGKIGGSPYNKTDLLYEEVKDLLNESVRENESLPFLKKYFEIAKNRTPKESFLIPLMENLEFEATSKSFDKHFMPKIPYLMAVFVEVEDGLYKKFRDQRNLLINELKKPDTSLEKKMGIKSSLKQCDKIISNYIINICRDEALSFPDFENYNNLKVCRFSFVEDGIYTERQGWKGFSSQILF